MATETVVVAQGVSRELPVGVNAFKVATYGLLTVGLCSAAMLFGDHRLSLLLIAAVMFGWSEIDNWCGMSHMGTLTPVMAMGRALWFKALASYCVAGLCSSAIVGASVGMLQPIVASTSSDVTLLAIAVLSLVLLARELDIVSFRLPRIRRQTQKMWAFQFGLVPAAAMWGAHIGLGIATVFSHGGFYVLLLLCAVLGPRNGALLMATYWVGRTLPIWFAPLLTPRSVHSDGPTVVALLTAAPHSYRHIAAGGLLISAVAAFALA